MPESIATSPVPSIANDHTPAGETTSLAFTRNQRLLLLAIGVVAYASSAIVFHYLPLLAAPGFGGSLFVDANPIISLTKVFVWTAIVFFIATFAGRSIRPDVGLFAAAIALFAARRSGGMTRETYLLHPTSSTLTLFAVELALLGVFLGVLHVITRQLVARGTLPDDLQLDGVRPKPEPTGQKFLALVTHALVFAVIVLLTVRSDDRMQVTGMLVVASIVASICTVRFIPATPSGFFWVGPIVAGFVAYLMTSVTGTANLAIGEPAGYCASLARALPLDFASAGVAGSLYGYWIGRGWIPGDALEKPVD
jgi:hypothetical protein